VLPVNGFLTKFGNPARQGRSDMRPSTPLKTHSYGAFAEDRSSVDIVDWGSAAVISRHLERDESSRCAVRPFQSWPGPTLDPFCDVTDRFREPVQPFASCAIETAPRLKGMLSWPQD